MPSQATSPLSAVAIFLLFTDQDVFFNKRISLPESLLLLCVLLGIE